MARFMDFGTDLVNLNHVIHMSFSEASVAGMYNIDMVLINGATVSRCVGSVDKMNNVHRQIRDGLNFISVE